MREREWMTLQEVLWMDDLLNKRFVKVSTPHIHAYIIPLCLQFRLHNCGVRHPLYLIEEYGDSAHLKMPIRSLVQAVANTQVHIKCTHTLGNIN